MNSTQTPFLSDRVRSVIHLKSLTTILLCVFIAVNLGHTAWIKGKAMVAQYLIANAWQQTVITGEKIKPWSWADTWPVAKLEFPTLKESLYVLAGSNGTSLAFGPGLADGSALSGQQGAAIIHGHRDTHFALLENLSIGDTVNVQEPNGHWQDYSVSEIHIVDTRLTPRYIDPSLHTLQMITCYPFNSSNLNPPLRYVVVAQATSATP